MAAPDIQVQKVGARLGRCLGCAQPFGYLVGRNLHACREENTGSRGGKPRVSMAALPEELKAGSTIVLPALAVCMHRLDRIAMAVCMHR